MTSWIVKVALIALLVWVLVVLITTSQASHEIANTSLYTNLKG